MKALDKAVPVPAKSTRGVGGRARARDIIARPSSHSDENVSPRPATSDARTHASGRRAIHQTCPFHELEVGDVCPWRVFPFQDGRSSYKPPFKVKTRTVLTDVAKPVIALAMLALALVLLIKMRDVQFNPYDLIVKVMPR